MTHSAASTGPERRGIDPRGPRFVASLTTVVLAAAVVTGNVWILLFQAVLFAVGAFAGIQHTPYSWLYRKLVRPRLGPPSELEDPKPPQFAQGVGLFVAGLGVVVALAGAGPVAVVVFGALAFVAAFLNAVFGLCLGCHLYLLLLRMRQRPA
jgi:uncharacterized protein DUF4395